MFEGWNFVKETRDTRPQQLREKKHKEEPMLRDRERGRDRQTEADKSRGKLTPKADV